IFEPDTHPIIFRYTGGIPRLVNTLCDTAMMSAHAQYRDVVTTEDIRAAIEELQWVEYTERSVRLQTLHGPVGGELSGDRERSSDRRIVLGRILVGFNGQTIAERELRPGRFIIGRTPDNDLQIDSKYISRHHAQIITSLDTCVLEDLNSTNGIYVRSKRVRRRILNDGDVVQIGQHELMYIDERITRNRVPADGEDDAVPLMDDAAQADVGATTIVDKQNVEAIVAQDKQVNEQL